MVSSTTRQTAAPFINEHPATTQHDDENGLAAIDSHFPSDHYLAEVLAIDHVG
jgi:hypothetical protein